MCRHNNDIRQLNIWKSKRSKRKWAFTVNLNSVLVKTLLLLVIRWRGLLCYSIHIKACRALICICRTWASSFISKLQANQLKSMGGPMTSEKLVRLMPMTTAQVAGCLVEARAPAVAEACMWALGVGVASILKTSLWARYCKCIAWRKISIFYRHPLSAAPDGMTFDHLQTLLKTWHFTAA